MQVQWVRALPLAVVVLFGWCSSAAAQTVITNNPPGASSQTSSLVPGQSVTIPVGSTPFTNFTFNFYSSANSGFASGNLFLLDQQYSGRPQDLGPSSPGFLGSSTASDNQWVFQISAPLQPNSQYFFYQSSQPSSPLEFFNSSTYSGGDRYFTINAQNPFVVSTGTDFAFQLSEQAVPAPIAGSGWIAWNLAMGLAFAVGARNFRRVKARARPQAA